MGTRRRYLPVIPDGLQVYVGRLYVAGCQHYCGAIEQATRLRDPTLRLELEPLNPHDRNALKVIVCGKGWLFSKSLHVGYVDAEMAERIARKGSLPRLIPRLRMIEAGEYVNVEYDLLGPKGGKKAFEA